MEDKREDNFRQLYTTNYRRSFLFVKRYVNDDAVAEDIVSEVMIKLWQTMKESVLDSPEAMLLTMLHNTSINYLKRKKIEMEALANVTYVQQRELEIRISALEDFTPDLIKLREISEIIKGTLSTLSPMSRDIFKMSRYENKTNKEIAESFDITVKAVEYHITKVLKILKEHLKDYTPFSIIPFFLFFI
jgi:RNA polymerase sigma-70 factor (ECF subfamily)